MDRLNIKSRSMRTAWFAVAVAAAAIATVALPGAAQDYPTREIQVVSAYAAGSGADTLTRFYSDRLSKLAGKPVIVHNKPGGNGVIGTEFTVRAKPDGHTLSITPSSNLSAAPYMFKRLPYDPMKDLLPVTTMLYLNFVLAVDAKSPIGSVRDLVAHLKARGERASYGMGNKTGQASVELFKDMAGLKTVPINYKSSAQAVTDLVNGQIDFMIWDATFLAGQARAGRIRLVAVTGTSRSSALPDVPTLAESGFPGFNMIAWFGVVVPKGTPKPIIDRLASWFGQINASEETRKFLQNMSADVFPGTPESMAAILKQETERWATLVKIANIEPQ